MLGIQSLQKIASGAGQRVAGMRKLLDALNTKLGLIESDKTRSRPFILEQIAAERELMLPTLQGDLAAIRDACATVQDQRQFWASRELLLSRQKFADDPAADAQIHANYRAELAQMSLPLLSLTMKNALADGALALVWSCVAAGRVAGYGDLPDWSAVQIPQQAEALALIDSLDASLAEGEMLLAGASGLSMDPARKLTFARRMNPSPPTTHNSPGRPLPSAA